jgi:hypothetical protein
MKRALRLLVLACIIFAGLFVVKQAFATNYAARVKTSAYHFNATRTTATAHKDYIGKLTGDMITAYPSQATDTTGLGVACTYLGGDRYLWSFVPTTKDVWKFYETHGADSLITGMDSVYVVTPAASDSVAMDFIKPKSRRGVMFSGKNGSTYTNPGPTYVSVVIFGSSDSISTTETRIPGYQFDSSNGAVLTDENGTACLQVQASMVAFTKPASGGTWSGATKITAGTDSVGVAVSGADTTMRVLVSENGNASHHRSATRFRRFSAWCQANKVVIKADSVCTGEVKLLYWIIKP